MGWWERGVVVVSVWVWVGLWVGMWVVTGRDEWISLGRPGDVTTRKHALLTRF